MTEDQLEQEMLAWLVELGCTLLWLPSRLRLGSIGYTRKFDGFCVITSDCDFTGLAMRLREEGLTVLGFGEKKTPEAFRNACHKFVFTEVLRPGAAAESVALARKIETASSALQRMGSRSTITTATVTAFRHTRSTAPSRIAADASMRSLVREGLPPAKSRAGRLLRRYFTAYADVS